MQTGGPAWRSRDASIYRVSITADDFGLSAGVNAAVATAARHGTLTAASLMANGPCAEEAGAIARSLPGLDTGVHLVLTCGRPLSDPQSVPSLVTPDGCFHDLGTLCRRLHWGKVALDEVEREWVAQIQRARDLGVTLGHLDGHHHIHLHPELAPLAARLALRYRLSARQQAPQWPGAIDPRTLLARLTLMAWARASSRHWRELAGAEQVWSLTAGAALRDSAVFLQWAHRLRPGWIEWLVHPATVDDIPPRLDRYGAGRVGELQALLNPALPAVLAAAAAATLRPRPRLATTD